MIKFSLLKSVKCSVALYLPWLDKKDYGVSPEISNITYNKSKINEAKSSFTSKNSWLKMRQTSQEAISFFIDLKYMYSFAAACHICMYLFFWNFSLSSLSIFQSSFCVTPAFEPTSKDHRADREFKSDSKIIVSLNHSESMTHCRRKLCFSWCQFHQRLTY